MKGKELGESLVLKVGSQQLEFGDISPAEKIFKELVADYVNKKFNAIKEQQIDTIKSYGYTLLEIAEEKIALEKKIEEKFTSLELKVSSLIEKLDSCLSEINT